MEIFLQACVNGLLMGGFYSLMGMGQNVIFGVMKIVNFCHGEMLMVGMYLTYVLSTTFGLDPYLCVPFVAVPPGRYCSRSISRPYAAERRLS